MALSGAHAEAMASSGTLDLIKSVLTKCIDSEEPEKQVLTAALSVLGRLGATASGADVIASGGALRRVVRAVSSKSAYIEDEGVMTSFMDLVRKSAATETGARVSCGISSMSCFCIRSSYFLLFITLYTRRSIGCPGTR
jgi:hypothetical protein